jgi:myo-inositol-1(or 4)-monophosphatase
VDPLDGTVNFLYGIPHWAVSVAVEDGEGVVAGVVHDACRGEVFTAMRGDGAHLNGTAIRASSCADLSRALVATGFAYRPDVRLEQASVVAAIIGDVRDIRRAGTASLDLAWTACGRLDAFFEWGLSPWDLAAGGLLVTEAAGALSALPRRLKDLDGVCASTKAIHLELVDRVVHGTP